MATKQKPVDLTSIETIREIGTLWQEFLFLQPRIRATLPTALVRAKERLHNGKGGQEFGEMQLFAFFRLAGLFISRGEPLAMGELSEALNLPMSSTTRMIDGLVEHGYAERRSDPNDRRVVRVALSEQGKELAKSFEQFFDNRVIEMLDHFTLQERAQIVHLLRKTIQILKTTSDAKE